MACDEFPILSPTQSEIILENRKNEQLLPLSIAETKDQGYGVFALEPIPKNTIVCSYLGEIRPHTSLAHNDKNDSRYELGWIGDRCLMVAAFQYSNIGRFLNSE